MKKTILMIGVLAAFASSAMAATPAKKHTNKKSTVSAVEKSEVTDVQVAPKKTGRVNKFEVEPAMNIAFVNPKDVNDLVRDTNDSVQKAGFKNFSIPQFGSTAGFGISAQYRVHNNFALGLGWSHLESTNEGSATVNGSSLNEKFGFRANLLTLDTKVILLQAMNNKLEGYVAPQIGVGFYGASTEVSGSALNNGSTEVLSSASGLVWGSTAGARYWVLENLSAGLYAGYRSAQSGTLKADSVKNAQGLAVGQDIDNNGKKLKLDASSFLLGAGVTWSI